MAAKKLGDVALGTLVKFKVDGVAREWLVVSKNHYGSNQVTLLLKNPFFSSIYDPDPGEGYPRGKYEDSSLDKAAKDRFYNLIEPFIRNKIIEVDIGILRKVFIPSQREYSDQKIGYQLFAGISPSSWNSIRGWGFGTASMTTAWTRSFGIPSGTMENPRVAYIIGYNGGVNSYAGIENANGVRPVVNLPSTLWVNDDGTLTDNVAPSVPASIVLPATINGGTSISISWSASTDPDGDSISYELDGSYNAGSSWTNLYRGTSTQASVAVTAGQTSVVYRVRAYDSIGNYSTYKMSEQKNIINNRAPGVPATITLPSTIRGGAQNVINWSQSTDPDGDTVTYQLEKQENSGGWTNIYTGTNIYYSHSVTKGIKTIAYRVRATDGRGGVSDYKTSSTKNVLNNTAPTIECSYPSGSNIGTKADDFSVNYIIHDVDTGDTLKVTEKIDNVLIRQYTATKDAQQSFTVSDDTLLKFLNGTHTMEIAVNDGTETVYHRLTFTKAVYKAYVSLKTPLENKEKKLITICAIAVTASIPVDAEYFVEVTNNGMDDNPVWEDCTNAVRNGRNHIFTNSTVENEHAFNVRVSVRRGPSNIGGWIESIQGAFQ